MDKERFVTQIVIYDESKDRFRKRYRYFCVADNVEDAISQAHDRMYLIFAAMPEDMRKHFRFCQEWTTTVEGVLRNKLLRCGASRY